MRANLVEKEPAVLKFWKDSNIYSQLNQHNDSKKMFIMHDGPPYANGSIHIGHALNKTIKDVACRFARLNGYFAPFVPGWDCHGLPIEWNVEKKLKKAKQSLSIEKFRQECREYAQYWIDQQSADFERLGVCANFEHPYRTMTPDAEFHIVSLLHRLLMDQLLYQSTKPVYWSLQEKTALAEAETEYIDKKSNAVFIKYPLHHGPGPSDKPVFLAIWTSTPWTIPASQAVAYNPNIPYVCVDLGNEYVWCAKALWESLSQKIDRSDAPIVTQAKGDIWQASECRHPWHENGYDHRVPLLAGDHVTDDQGTGFVHTAPAHGLEDHTLCQAHNITPKHILDDDGYYHANTPLVGGLHIMRDEDKILALLKPHLYLQHTITHSYPHSWRSKTPLIMRATPQWFIAIDALKEQVLRRTPSIKWIPDGGQQRLESMLKNRNDWCVSRQRCWGVPIAIFVHKETGAPLCDPTILKNIAQRIARHGCDRWFIDDDMDLLPEHLRDQYKKVTDIVDVWFESGTTFSYVLQASELYPADIIIEGSDQHRGWFQSSLLCSVYSQSQPCTRTIFTHGFVVDEKGYKMSKSLGNVLTVDEVMKRYGADILRLALIQSDYHNDVKLGHEILTRQRNIYCRIRNTLRFILGNLRNKTTHFTGALPLLEQYILYRLYDLHQKILTLLERFRYHDIFVLVKDFCTQDLSSFYFDIRKDTLYCEGEQSTKRLACLSTLTTIFQYLIRWLAPVLPFTTEDAWQNFPGKSADSIHLTTFPHPPSSWHKTSIATTFQNIFALRDAVLKEMETLRQSGNIGSSLETNIEIYGSSSFSEEDLEDILITSRVRLSANANPNAHIVGSTKLGFVIHKAPDSKCQRCWKQRNDTVHNLCPRCLNVMENIQSSE